MGQILDPLADKLLISATLISIVQLGLAPAWMVTVIIGREFAVTGLRSIAYARGLAMPASNLGKLKMVSQVVAILLLILGWERMPLLLLAGAGGAVGGDGDGAVLGHRLLPPLPPRVRRARRRSPTSTKRGGRGVTSTPRMTTAR